MKETTDTVPFMVDYALQAMREAGISTIYGKNAEVLLRLVEIYGKHNQ